MTVDRPAERDGASVVADLERAVILREPLVHPDRKPGQDVVDDEMGVFVEDRAQRVGTTIGADQDVVDVLPRNEQPPDIDLLPLENRLEGIERLLVRKHHDNGGHRGGGDTTRQQSRQRFTETFELGADHPKPRLAHRPEQDEVRGVDARPLRLRGRGRTRSGNKDTDNAEEPAQGKLYCN